MFKRVLISIGTFVAIFLLGSALVGYDVISANAGIVVWLLGIIGAVVVFYKAKSKDNYK